MTTTTEPIRIFISSAQVDGRARDQLLAHLAPLERAGLIKVWHEGLLEPGSTRTRIVEEELDAAEIILVLVSAAFNNSDSCWALLERALGRHRIGKTSLVPILVSATDVEKAPFTDLQVLPRDGKHIAAHTDPEAAWADVAKELRLLISARADQLRHLHSLPLAPSDIHEGVLPRHGGDLAFLTDVERACRIRYPDATITREHAPAPFEGVLIVIQKHGRLIDVTPIGVLNAPVTNDFLETFIEVIDLPRRRQRPSLRSVLVHIGRAAPDHIFQRAFDRGIDLHSFDEYQGIIDFTRYLSWQMERLARDPEYLAGLYVPQRAQLRVGLDRTDTDDALRTIYSELLSPYPRFILVLGDFGTGKTFLMRELARRMSEDSAAPPPVLVEMRALEKSLGLDKLLAQHFQIPGIGLIHVDAFRYMLAEGKAALLFDGFDELAFRVTYDRVLEHFETVLQAAQGRAKVVVTSRTAHFLSDHDVELALAREAGRVPGYRLVKLQAFDRHQIRDALVKRFGDEIQADARLQLLDEVQDLMGLSGNPRMLSFILEIPPEDLEDARSNTGRITNATLYDLLVTKWLEGEIERAKPRGAEAVLDIHQLRRAVTDLAMLLWPRTDQGLRMQDIPKDLWASLQRLDPARPLDPDEAKSLVGSRSLLIRNDEGRFSFLHQSILEWLVASATASEVVAAGHADALAQRPMSALMADFFSAMVGKDTAVRWAQRALRDRSSGEILVANANNVLKRLDVDVNSTALKPAHDTPQIPLHLAGRSLRGQDLSGATHLRGANLNGADLSGTTLVRADLSGANLKGALLVQADLREAVLRNADLTQADLSGANLLGADLHGAFLVETWLRFTKILRANLQGTVVERINDFSGLFGPWYSEEPCPVAEPPAQPCSTVAFGPDCVLLASGYADGTVILWNTAERLPLRILQPHSLAISTIAFDSSGRLLATGSWDKTVVIYNVRTGQILHTLYGHSAAVLKVEFNRSASVLASASVDGTIRLWDTMSGRRRRLLSEHSGTVWSVAFSQDDEIMASASSDQTIRLWSTDSGYPIRSLTVPNSHSICVRFKGDALVSISADTTICSWTVPTGASIGVTRLWDSMEALGVAISQDCSTMAMSLADGSVHLVNMDVNGGIPYRRDVQSPNGEVFGVALSPDARVMAAGSTDTNVYLWDAITGLPLRPLSGHNSSVLSVSFLPDGRTLLSGSSAHPVSTWNTDNCARIKSLAERPRGVRRLCHSSDGKAFATVSDDRGIQLWNAPQGEVITNMVGHTGDVLCLAFSNDAKMLASGAADRTVRLWSASGGITHNLVGHRNDVRAVAFDPGDAHVASGSADRTVCLWSTGDGNLKRRLHTRAVVNGLAFGPGGVLLAMACDDGTVRVWDTTSGEIVERLTGHSASVRAVLFSSDGSIIASCSCDKTIIFWDLARGISTHVLTGHQAAVNGASFGRGDKLLASCSDDGTVRLWRVSTGECLATLVSAREGWASFTPKGFYKVGGDITGSFWHLIGLSRFEPGELDPYLEASLRVPHDASLLPEDVL